MNAKEYLKRAYWLDQQISTKLSRLESLRALATRCGSALTGMPGNPNRAAFSIADTITKIVDMQDEINRDIDRLVDLKREIITAISGVGDIKCKTVLEKRYLCFLSWEQIAEDMQYGADNIFKIHKKALELVSVPESLQ